MPEPIEAARKMIEYCESNLGQQLTQGERASLLLENMPQLDGFDSARQLVEQVRIASIEPKAAR